MALEDNRPSTDRLRRALRHVDSAPDEMTLGELLEGSIGWIEDRASTPFNGRRIREKRDGNGTNGITVKRGPITSVREVKVELPVLALTRVYTDDEVKVYPRSRRLTIFTFKLAAEHATLHLDQQVYANIFPALPQCVHLDYTAGYPRYDAAADYTSLDGSTGTPEPKRRLAGDARDPDDLNRLEQLRTAAVCDAAATYMGCIARNEVGLVGSVSFDGFSKNLNADAFGPAIQQLIQRRDDMLKRAIGSSGLILSSTTGR